MEERMNKLHRLIETHAGENELVSVKKALMLMQRTIEKDLTTESAREKLRQALLDSYEVCVIVMDLHPVLTKDEEDLLYAGILLLTYPKNFPVENLKNKVTKEWGFREEIWQFMDTMLPGRNWSDEDLRRYYARIQENKLTLLAALADRGHTVQGIYTMSTWNANRIMEETKMCYYPMGLYGKEHYHEILPTIIVLLEKMRTLLEVAEIFLRRYEARESELIREIQMVREENAMIKGIIEEYQSEE